MYLVLWIWKLYCSDFFKRQRKQRNYIGSDENWEKAENAIINAADKVDYYYIIEYGEAAFYGPKLDFMVKML
jgi:threonyl-tRNA synthetase